MNWTVEFHPEFESEFKKLTAGVQDELLATAKLLKAFGPQLGRPHVDTLKGSHYANMKELRFEAENGEWRTAFAFDLQRKAILLVAGGKSGVSEKLFYRGLIAKADKRFTSHLEQQKAARKASTTKKGK